MNLDYQELHREESAGSFGAFGIKILVAVHPPTEEGHQPVEVNLDHQDIRFACYDAKKMIQTAIMEKVIASLTGAQARAKAEREQLLSLFPQPIHVEAIPNGYCSEFCCKHLPWFIVTTTVGRIKVGWRKRVICIDWSQTQGTKTAAVLFDHEDVTKDERGIHAWSYEDAKAYVGAIISGEPIPMKTQ
jgi:hypothetical protein